MSVTIPGALLLLPFVLSCWGVARLWYWLLRKPWPKDEAGERMKVLAAEHKTDVARLEALADTHKRGRSEIVKRSRL